MGGGGDGKVEEQESRLALAEQAAIQLRRYNEVFVPLENQYITDAKNQFSDVNYAKAMGAASTTASGVYEKGLKDMRRGAFNRGFDPSSGAFQGETAMVRAAQRGAMGGAGADAGITNTDTGFRHLQNVVNMGQGLSNEAMEGQIDVAAAATDRLNQQAESDFLRSSSIQEAVGGATGAVTSYGLNRRDRRVG